MENKVAIKIKDKNVKIFLSFFILALFLEIFIFNFRSWQSIFFQEINTSEINFGSGIQVNQDGSWTIISNENTYFEFSNIKQDVKNIKLDIENPDNYTNLVGMRVLNDSINLSIYASDEASQVPVEFPEMTILHNNERSQFITFNLSGKAEKIKVQLNDLEGKTLIKHEIKLNARRPIMVSKARFFLVYIIILFVYFYRKNTLFNSSVFDQNKRKQKLAIMVYLILQCTLFFYLEKQSLWCIDPPGIFPQHQQYQMLAHALKNGNFYLDISPSAELLAMKNPYDLGARTVNNIGYIWDLSFYQGKYYVYFGVVPALFTYLPYYLLTGNDLPNYIAVFLGEILLTISIVFLLYQITKRFFSKIPFMVYLLLCIVVVNCCGSLYVSQKPEFYSIPILFAVGFMCFGIGFWVSASKSIEKSKIKIFLGSLFIALIAGCRPQLLLSGFLAVPLFKKYFFAVKDGCFFHKEKLKVLGAFFIPFLVVAFFIMYYNFMRFGSVTDFGATYNLTTNDMTKRGWKFDRSLLGLFSYLFQQPVITATFPFVHQTLFETNYQGVTIHEPMFGGILITNSILYFLLFLFSLKSDIKDNRIYHFSLISIIIAIIIVLLDTQMAGILYRYTMDFTMFLYIPAIVVVLIIIQNFGNYKVNSKKKQCFYNILLFFSIISLVFSVCVIFSKELEYFKFNPLFYYTVKSLLQFW